MEHNKEGKYSGFFSKRLKAGKRRTYFFDVKNTKQGDFFVTITESKKKFEGEGYESHKLYLYKEDFKKFIEALNETVDYIKTELLPDFDYDAERPVISHTNRSAESLNEETSKESPKESPKEEQKNDSTNTPPAPQIGDDEQMDWN